MGPSHATDGHARIACPGPLAEQERSEEGGGATRNLGFSLSACSARLRRERGLARPT